MRHQSPVRSRARSEYFNARAVRVQLHTRVFLKFKSSCTVAKFFSVHNQLHGMNLATYMLAIRIAI